MEFLFYVANVYFDAQERGELMGTFLETCRLEKLPKINVVFPIIHYNRDFNTNTVHLLLVQYHGEIW